MDTYSSGEELLIKTRKPYTITKQRERWTEEEHNRFLEALKLYGRAWQRIEEHIGTKTAVQIRSHAQKFFSKLEKEALVKGIPVGQAIDIDIPPPRPKRKPSNPYPRKTGSVCGTTAQAVVKDGKQLTSGSSPTDKQVLDLEKRPLSEKAAGDESQGNLQEIHDDGQLAKSFTAFQGSPSSLLSSGGKFSVPTTGASDSCNLREYAPMPRHMNEQSKSIQSRITDGPSVNPISDGSDTPETIQNDDTENEMQAAKNFPRHVPVHILGSLGTCSQAVSSDVSYQESPFQHMGIHAHPAMFTNFAASATVESQNSTSRSIYHQKVPDFNPSFVPFRISQEDHCSFLQMSSAFSSLIVSTLLQNPAAHAAASFAASFWPFTSVEASAESPAGPVGSFPHRQVNPAPSMAAIAAATVAAATAWWTAHGLLPLCAPFHPGFVCPPASTPTAPSNADQTPAVQKEKEENGLQNITSQDQRMDHEFSDAIEVQHSELKSPATSLSDSGDSLGAKTNDGTATADNEKIPAVNGQKDSSKGIDRKPVDRSSCGSNTASSSEVDIDALQKQGETKEEAKEPNVTLSAGEPSNRRSRNTSNINDPWKEVSEEGRMAFQALFLREVLPQSFSPPLEHLKIYPEGTMENPEQYNGKASQLDISSNTWGFSSSLQAGENIEQRDTIIKEGLLTLGLCQSKLKYRKTGFKPYKRCSVEARDSVVANAGDQEQDHGPKRLRLEGETSI